MACLKFKFSSLMWHTRLSDFKEIIIESNLLDNLAIKHPSFSLANRCSAVSLLRKPKIQLQKKEINYD